MRLPDWPARLDAFLLSRRDMPFSYEARNDCVMFCDDAIEAITGSRICPWTYQTRKQALRLMQVNGGLVSMVDSLLSRRQGLPQRGDIGFVEHQGQEFLAVCWLEFVVTPGKERQLRLPASSMRFAWAVD